VPKPPGLPGAERESWRRTLAAIIDGLRAIAAEEPIEDDPLGEQLTARLTSLLDPADAAAASAMIHGRDVYSEPLVGFPAGFVFPVAVQKKIVYDAGRQQLRYRGAMTATEQLALLAVVGLPPAVKIDYDPAVKALFAQPRALIARGLRPLFAPAEGELVLLATSSLDASGNPDVAAIDAKIEAVLTRRRDVLSRSLVKQTVSTATALDADVVALLLDDDAVLTALSTPGPAMIDYLRVQGTGLAAEYFPVPTLAGAPAVVQDDPAIAFDWKGVAPVAGVPVVGFSVRWSGQVYVPAAGEVTFHVICTDGVRVFVNDSLIIDEWNNQPKSQFTAKVKLDGAEFYPIVVEYYNQTGGALIELRWSSPSIAATVVPTSALYTSTSFSALLQSVERLYKLAKLLVPFTLTAREVRALSVRGDLTLDLVPLHGPAPLVVAQAVFAQWQALARFAALRDRFPASEVHLIDVGDAPTPAEARQRFVKLTGIAPATLDGIIEALTIDTFDPIASVWSVDAPDLTRFEWWTRVADVFAVVGRTGASPAQLLAWARAREFDKLPTGPNTVWIAWTAVDLKGTDRRAQNRQRAQQAKDLVRARYDEERWRAAAPPLNDQLRVRRRSALTAFVLAMPEMMRANVTTTGRMFEFFLIDPEMEPCMQTSRIKQGISSVQLFVHRVLLNLESPLVPPSRVDRARWEWMQAYRVWEANRKIFLYPESYAEGEFRDNKTPIFEELESELLQDDLTEPNIERAFRRAAEKLHAVGKLTVCGMCIDHEKSALHVFARTASAPFAYYHRELVAGRLDPWHLGAWGPWRKLPVDVAGTDDGERSGVHMVPIVWNRRVYLFWPIFDRKPDTLTNARLPEGFDPLEGWHIRLAWSEYQDNRWSPRLISLPFVTSMPFVVKTHSTLDQTWNYTPFHLIVKVKEYFLGILIDSYQYPLVKPRVIQDNPMLNGVVVEKAGDFAYHAHHEEQVTIASLLPTPSDHFLDAQISGSSLTVGLFRRFKGTPRGQGRTITVDTINVARDGRRTDRTERNQDDYSVTGAAQRVFDGLGRFQLPACQADLATIGGIGAKSYEALTRPQDTINSFMGFIADWPRVAGLRISTTAGPLLKWVPNRFEVNDADNRAGFSYLGPFVYQDQERCYLVTREGLSEVFTRPELYRVHPDMRLQALEYATTLGSIAEHSVGVAPDAPIVANAWAESALARWSAGPSVPLSLRVTSGPVAAISATAAFRNLAYDGVLDEYLDVKYTNRDPRYRFTTIWHPHTCAFLAALNSGGIPALFTLENQLRTDKRTVPAPPGFTNNFETIYKPDPAQVVRPYPMEDVDFTRSGAYSTYNWELFFHAPLMVAMRLSRSGKYEAALRWFHYIFDPMTGDPDTSDRRFWRFLPFRTADVLRIEELLHLLTYTGTDAVKLKQKAELQASIQEWLTNPFRPHVLARRRPVAYMKHVFMKYLDTLIAWGDELFQRDTIEAINQATQLYVLAANLLGPKPQRTPPPGPVAPETYQSLRHKLDQLSNAQVDLETRLPFTQFAPPPPSGSVATMPKLPETLYFCLPHNEKLLAYWDIIADRLFKIRHCMNIEGTVRQLPLFEPPIEPMLLVEAAARGLDIGSVLNDLYAPLPRYRFTFTLQQALSFCGECRSLGSALQGVLEKRDAEQLAALRVTQETRLLDHMREAKKLLIQEAEETRRGLADAALMAKSRIQYYENLLAQGLTSEEEDQLGDLDTSNERQETASWIEATAQMLNLIPTFSYGSEWSVSFGGSNLGAAATAIGRSYTYLAASYSYKANRAAITGGHVRRADEWRFQRDLAKRELRQIEHQIAAATIRRQITEHELRTHETQLEHSKAIEELLRTRFTNDALYSWMEGTLRTLYFQCFQAAYEVARRAERCWRYERGADASFVQFGAWDSSVRGLLAGERLYLQLKQMERAYLEKQVREFEITKHVSLLQLDPIAVIALKETGACEIDVPEWLFDLDFPGHYFRRLKTVSVTVPAVVGPYTSLSATLTLLSSKVRTSSRISGAYDDDENYRPDHLAVEAIAASSGQNDSGRFELELRDEQYLPFEGAGVISRWRIELPRRFRSFDYDTISDVVLHMKYTARRDEMLTTSASTALQARFAAAGGTLFRLFSLRHEFPNEWRAMRMASTHAATFTITKDRFPLLVQGGGVTVVDLHYALILREPRPAVSYAATLTPPATGPLALSWPAQPGRYRSGAQAVNIPIVADPANSGWRVQITAPAAAAELDRIQDILIVARYSAVL
jgi:hypothetical protein